MTTFVLVFVKQRVSLIVAMCVVLVSSGYNPLRAATKPEVGVVTLHAKSTPIFTQLPGRVAAFRVAEIRPQVGGVIQKLLFTEGQDVVAGQQLYQIDPALLEASLASAEATEAKAIATTASNLVTVNRDKSMVIAGAVSRQTSDNDTNTFNQSTADVASGKAAVATAKINLSYARVTSPISGRTGRSSVTEGALVAVGQTTSLVTVTQMNPIYVDVSQSSDMQLRLKRELGSGQLKSVTSSVAPVKLSFGDGTPYEEPGKLQFSEVTVDQSSGSVILRAIFPNDNGQLLPGMFVVETIEEGIRENAILAPQRGVTRVASIMDARHAEIVDWLIREAGSTRTKAEIEWQSTRNGIVEAATYPFQVVGRILPSFEAGKENRVYRRPLGVVGVISPWNFPLYLSTRSIAPAIAVGNSVVVKPAEDTPITGGLLIAKLFEEAGLPPGVLNVVVGLPDVIGDAFTSHPTPKLISFTGSTRVGRHVGALAIQGTSLKRVALELGGNAPFVVLDDADLEQAVHAAVVSRFLHAGQICMSTNRIIVDAKLYDAFVQGFVARVKALPVGDPNDAKTVIGPVINQKQLNGISARITEARAAGTRLVVEGEAQGLVLPAHVFVDVANDSRLAQAEIFGPVAPIIKARDEAEALIFANATEYGLSSAVFSRDEGRALAFAQQIDAGMTHINDISVNDDPNTMFGGEKNSGLGRFNGEWIIGELTSDHWISVQHTPRQYPF